MTSEFRYHLGFPEQHQQQVATTTMDTSSTDSTASNDYNCQANVRTSVIRIPAVPTSAAHVDAAMAVCTDATYPTYRSVT